MSSWDLIQLYFATTPLHISSHHLESYNDFIKNKIPNVIRCYKMNPIIILKENPNVRIEVFIGQETNRITYHKRMSKDNNGKLQLLLPNEARLKNLSYSADIYCDIDIIYKYDQTKEGYSKTFTKKFPNQKIGTIPIMLHSCLCATSMQEKQVLQDMGECPYDQGGYFIIDGKEKVIVSQERNVTNKLFINKNLDTEIYKYSGFIRCTNFENCVFLKTINFDVRGFKPSEHTDYQNVWNMKENKKYERTQF